MVLSRILGADMSLFCSLRFLTIKASGIKAAGRFNRIFTGRNSFLGFQSYIISTLKGIRVCDCLFSSSLIIRSIKFDYRSIPQISIGGESNDFYE